MSRALDTTCEYRPSLWSFFLFKNQSGILNCRGFPTITIRFSSSAALSSPALSSYKESLCQRQQTNSSWQETAHRRQAVTVAPPGPFGGEGKKQQVGNCCSPKLSST